MILKIITKNSHSITGEGEHNIEFDIWAITPIKKEASGMAEEDFCEWGDDMQCYEISTPYNNGKNLRVYTFQRAYLTNKEGKTVQRYG